MLTDRDAIGHEVPVTCWLTGNSLPGKYQLSGCQHLSKWELPGWMFALSKNVNRDN
jgi:hypothetical protein